MRIPLNLKLQMLPGHFELYMQVGPRQRKIEVINAGVMRSWACCYIMEMRRITFGTTGIY